MKWQLLVYILFTMLLCFLFPDQAYTANRSVIVGFHKKPSSSEENLIRRNRGRIRRTYGRIRAMSVTLDDKAIERVKRYSNVSYVEDDAVISSVDSIWSQEYSNSWGVYHIGAGVSHTSGNKGRGVKIAIIDTGIDYTHDDLKDNFRGGRDFVFDDDDPYDDSWNSHGTHIAGIIAARENKSGVIGVAPEADVYAVKVLDGAGFGLLSWLIAGIEWSIDNGMDIINLSIQGEDLQSLRAACESAYSAGVLIIAAAGNSSGREVLYPAAYSNVIAVTGTDANNMQAYFSPYGSEIELAAPGVDILSSIANWDYETLSGTSQAAAHVAGTAALFFASDLEDINGDRIIDNVDVRLMLQKTAVDLGEEGPDDVFGFGLVDASAASFQTHEPLSLTVKRNSSSPRDDTETVSLSGAIYKIKIKPHGLRGIKMAVYEGDTFKKKLSRYYRFIHRNMKIYRLFRKNKKEMYRFFRKKRRTRTISIDARNTEYDIYFTPYGRRGASARLIITEKPVDP